MTEQTKMDKSLTQVPFNDRLMAADKSKSVRIYQNGNEHAAAHTLVVDKRKCRSFDVFLDHATTVLKCPFGVIRRLYSVDGGHVVSSLDDICDGMEYVAATNEKFKPINYSAIPDTHTRELHRAKQVTEMPMMPRIVRSGRATKAASQPPKIISIVENGDTSGHGLRLLLHKRNAITFEQVLSQISERMNLRHGAVRKLYTMEGKEVTSLDGFVDAGEYVASDRLPFIQAEYNTKHIGMAGGSPIRKGPKIILAQPLTRATTLAPKPVSLRDVSPSKARAHSDIPLNSKPEKYEANKPPRHPNPASKGGKLTTPSPSPHKPAHHLEVLSPTPAKVTSSPIKPKHERVRSRSPSPSPALASQPKPLAAPPKPKQPLKPAERVQGYNVTVITGDDASAATTANVFITIYGSKGNTGKRKLNDGEDHFTRHATDVFAIEAGELGEVTKVKIEHDNSGPSSSWLLDRIIIRDVVTNKKYYFHLNQWLSDTRGAMQSAFEIDASSDPTPPSKQPRRQQTFDKNDEFLAKAAPVVAETVDDGADTKLDRPLDQQEAERVDDIEEEEPQSTSIPAQSRKASKQQQQQQDPSPSRKASNQEAAPIPPQSRKASNQEAAPIPSQSRKASKQPLQLDEEPEASAASSPSRKPSKQPEQEQNDELAEAPIPSQSRKASKQQQEQRDEEPMDESIMDTSSPTKPRNSDHETVNEVVDEAEEERELDSSQEHVGLLERQHSNMAKKSVDSSLITQQAEVVDEA